MGVDNWQDVLYKSEGGVYKIRSAAARDGWTINKAIKSFGAIPSTYKGKISGYDAAPSPLEKTSENVLASKPVDPIAQFITPGKTIADLQAYKPTEAVIAEAARAREKATTITPDQAATSFANSLDSNGPLPTLSREDFDTIWEKGSVITPDQAASSFAKSLGTPIQMANNVTGDVATNAAGNNITKNPAEQQKIIEQVDAEAARDKAIKMGMQPDAPGEGMLPSATMGSGPGAPAAVEGGIDLAKAAAVAVPVAIGVGGVANAVSSVVNADKVAKAEKEAADVQATATEKVAEMQKGQYSDALKLLEKQYNDSRHDLAPWRAAGEEALGYTQDAAGNWVTRPSGGLRTFNQDNPDFNFDLDPAAQRAYTWRLDQGLKALENSASARGTLKGGNTLKAITEYGQGAASQEYDNAFNRYQTTRAAKLNHLQSLAGVGQTAVQQTNSAGQNYANNAGAAGQNYANNAGAAYASGANARAQGITGAANANAAGWMGAGNALTNMLGSYIQHSQGQANQQMLNSLISGRY